MPRVFFVFIYLLLIANVLTHRSANFLAGFGHGHLSTVRALVNSNALLPCDVTPTNSSDSVLLILVLKGDRPIYSVDVRNGGRGDHWLDSQLLHAGSYFDILGHSSGLLLHKVSQDLEGEYECRVDFKDSPTRHLKMALQIIVPPREMIIYNEAGLKVSGQIGPFLAGQSVTLRCQVFGGIPTPWVAWIRDKKTLENATREVSTTITESALTLDSLSRNDLLKEIVCVASNSNISPVISSSVVLDMIFPPSTVSIGGQNTAFIEGSNASVFCVSRGSRPPAVISWWKKGLQLRDHKIQTQSATGARTAVIGGLPLLYKHWRGNKRELIFVGAHFEYLNGGNMTKSILHLRPSWKDDKAGLYCRAENEKVPGKAVEDEWRMQVLYKPRLVLKPGNEINLSDTKEGGDVYFQCQVKANPEVELIEWEKDGQIYVPNITRGELAVTDNLVLQKVSKASSGKYKCTSFNSQGSSESKEVHLKVKYLPKCVPNQKIIYGGSSHEPVRVSCEVDSYPEPSFFKWAFNTTTDMTAISNKRVYKNDKVSIVEYTPQIHLDFGTLICLSQNEVGWQKEPCIFKVVPADLPDSVSNCSARQSLAYSGTISVLCEPGWDGGLKQIFRLEVRRKEHGKPQVVLKSFDTPKFLVNGLAPGTEYLMKVFSKNSEGVSDPLEFSYFNPIDIAEKRLSVAASSDDAKLNQDDLEPEILSAIIIGVIGCLVVVLVAVVAFVRLKLTQKKKKMCNERDKQDEGGFSKQDLCPDVILVSSDGGSSENGDNSPPSVKKGRIYVNPRVAVEGQEDELIFEGMEEAKVLLPYHSTSPSDSPVVAPRKPYESRSILTRSLPYKLRLDKNIFQGSAYARSSDTESEV